MVGGFCEVALIILVQDKKSDRINRMNKIILFFIMVNPKFTIS